MEKYEENLHKAVKEIKIADHILYITYHIVKDKRLLVKALEQEYSSLMSIINAILQYDYLWKRIQLYKDSRLNLETFVDKCSRRYLISEEEISKVKEIISVYGQHKKSPMEFMRKDKVIIMSDSLKTNYIDLERLKKYLETVRKIIKKAAFSWNKNSLLI